VVPPALRPRQNLEPPRCTARCQTSHETIPSGTAILAPDSRPRQVRPKHRLRPIKRCKRCTRLKLVGRAEEDPRPCRVLLREVAIGQHRYQTRAIRSRDQGAGRLRHNHSIAQAGKYLNLSYASVL
jgi:hypothetical protein